MQVKFSAGVNLVEMMTVLIIIAILATIAYPTYQTFILESNRLDARSSLLDWQSIIELRNAADGIYPTAAQIGLTTPTSSSENFYIISLVRTDTTYTLTATADPTGVQAQDTACQVLTVDNTNIKRGGPNAGATVVGDCWQ